MESMMCIVIFTLLGLFVVAQGISLKPEDLEQYYKCWTYTQCDSDKALQKIVNCIEDNLNSQEAAGQYKFIDDNYYMYKSDDLAGARKEYCSYDNDKRHNAYDKTLKGVLAYEQKLCSDPSEKDVCSKLGKTIGCVFNYLSELQSEGKC